MNYLEKLQYLYDWLPFDNNPILGLKDGIHQNLIKAKDVDIPNAQILKYNPATTMFKGNWNQYTVNGARGNIVDKDTFEPINMPFPKLFEASELDIVVPSDTPVLAFRKRNGFMLSVTWYNGELIVGTTGTIDSDYANLGRSYIQPWMKEVFKKYSGHTFLFEVCDPSDPHIFPEPQGLYLIGYRANEWGSHPNVLVPYHNASLNETFRYFKEGINFDHPIISTYGEIELRSMVEDCEGYVVWINNRYPLKLKCQHYKIRKKLARAKGDKLYRLVQNLHPELFNLKIYRQLQQTVLTHFDEFSALEEQKRLQWLTDVMKELRE